MSVHDGHRKRLRQRFMDEGLDHFSDIQVLELLLFYSRPRGDVNPLAHQLLETFGSLPSLSCFTPRSLSFPSKQATNESSFLAPKK